MARDDPDQLDAIQRNRSEPRPDFSQPLPRQELPQELQDRLDNEEKWWDNFSMGKADDSTHSSVRYAAYARNFRTILLSAHRYVAYTSEIGESFRPIAHPRLVTTAYGISWAYIIGDVSYEGYKAYMRNQATLHPHALSDLPAADSKATPGRIAPVDHWGAVTAQRAVFQSLASMGLPAFTIHTIVKYSGRALKGLKNQRIRTWAPVGLGLSVVPLLPRIFDEPVEEATEWVFHKAFETFGGPEAVGHRPAEETLDKGLGKRKEGIVVLKDKEV